MTDDLHARIVPVTDPDAPELAVYFHLTENQLRSRGRPDEGLFIAESAKVIRCALNGGWQPVSVLTEERHIAGDLAPLLPRMGDIPVYTGGREQLSRLTGYALTRGVLCAMRRRPLPSLDRVLAGARRVAVTEDMTDTTNMGAFFRSAAALGVDAVLLTAGCCDPLCRRSVRVSMGTVFQIPWAAEEDGYLALLAREGFETLALALDERARDVRDDTLYRFKKTALLLGTEGTGLRKETVAGAGYTVKIPMKNGADSLNVAAAAAVAFWEMNRRADAPETGRKEQTDG